jgi:hypothetical protein
MPSAPIRALPPTIEALRYLDRARQFRRAAMMHSDVENGQPFWPKWFLITHALELAINAYIVSRGCPTFRSCIKATTPDIRKTRSYRQR